MRIYFATWLFEKSHGKSCTKQKANNRLLSYFFLNQGEISKIQLENYVKRGRLNINKRRK